MIHTRSIVLLVWSLFAADDVSAQLCGGLPAPPRDAQYSIESGGRTRTYRVYLPASYDRSRRTPVVLAFHDSYIPESIQQTHFDLEPKADAAGFILVYPSGAVAPGAEVGTWNGGGDLGCCPPANMPHELLDVDDVGFVRDLIDQLERDFCVDERRVFATGMGSGSLLSHRLACEVSDRIAAVAPVSGQMTLPTCEPPRPMPVLYFHGTGDPFAPYAGIPGILPSVDATMTGWAERNGCSVTPVEIERRGKARLIEWPGCLSGVQVQHWRINRGGHMWPGGRCDLRLDGLSPLAKCPPWLPSGTTTYDISANDELWRFFQMHPLP